MNTNINIFYPPTNSPTILSLSVPDWQVKETDLWIKSYPSSYNYLLSLFKNLKITFNKKYISRIHMSEILDGYNPYQFQDLINKYIGVLEKKKRDEMVNDKKAELNKTLIPRIIDTTINETKADLFSVIDIGGNYLLIGAGILALLYLLKN